MPYVKNTSVFTCPNGPHTGVSFPNQALVGPSSAPMVVNLAINQYIEDRNYGFASLAALSAAKNAPADVSMVAESCYAGIYQDWTDDFAIPGRPAKFGVYRLYCANGIGRNICMPRHKDHGVNIIYVDGHAKFVPGGRINGGAADGREYPIVNPNSAVWQ